MVCLENSDSIRMFSVGLPDEQKRSVRSFLWNTGKLMLKVKIVAVRADFLADCPFIYIKKFKFHAMKNSGFMSV